MRQIKDLHHYQIEGVEWIKDRPHCALFLDMGLGKTVTTLTAVNHLIYSELDITRVLVIAPKRVAESVWEEEISEWQHLKHLKVSKIMGKPRQRIEAINRDADVYTISRDNVAWLCGLYGGNKIPFDCLVIDELSSFKNPNSVRFKALRQVQPSFRRVIGLTGTPSPNGLIDLWSQIYLLDRGQRLYKFIGHFRDEFFRPGKRNGATIYSYDLKKGGEERIYEKISDIVISMKASDYLELPGRMVNHIKIKFDEKLKKQYLEFEKEQVLNLLGENQDVEITALNAAALSNKLLQFANGAIYDVDKNYHVVHDLKIDALEEIIEAANGKPVLVAWTYRSDMARIKEKLKKHSPRELKTDQDIKDWNAGKISLLTMHPASGGHGLNLQAGGNIIVWFGQTWSLELEQQFNARLDRQGQTKTVIINKLIVEGSMDEDVIKAQNRKTNTQNALMEAVKARINKWK